MIKKHRVYSFLINNSYKTIHQATIHSTCNCTAEYTCKLIKKLIKKGIVLKNQRNSVFVKNPLMLSFILAFESTKKKPLMYKTPKFKDLLSVLKQTTYSLTLDSALEIKKHKLPEKVQAYVLGKDINILNNNFRITSNNPDLIVYPSDHFSFIKQQLIDDKFLVTDYDLFIDFLKNNKLNKAIIFAKKYKLFKTIM
jgi:hypothetical protein